MSAHHHHHLPHAPRPTLTRRSHVPQDLRATAFGISLQLASCLAGASTPFIADLLFRAAGGLSDAHPWLACTAPAGLAPPTALAGRPADGLPRRGWAAGWRRVHGAGGPPAEALTGGEGLRIAGSR